ncbi:MAG: phosphoenolpyruvate--protein phosphotransferase [Alphaproteobacteria bacterium]|nr:phosphoenolpyruvate--protein phosphotransferase [Alphaproteobacteria bacterium]
MKRVKVTQGETRRSRERIFEGLGVSVGIAIGPAFVRESGTITVPESRVPAAKVGEELSRFERAVAAARRQIQKLKSRASGLPPAAKEEIGYLLDAYLQMLSDSRLVRGVLSRIETDRVNAESAVQAEISEIAKSFEAMDDAYLAARVQDIREVGNRLVRHLTKAPLQGFALLPEGTVIVAEDLSPADTALMDPHQIAGFTTLLGGAESHTAIMARSLGLPAVVGVSQLFGEVRSGKMIILDGSAGQVIVDPTPETLSDYRRRKRALDKERQNLARLRRLPAVTKDGVEIDLQANLELPRELENALSVGAGGIGLLRSEFLYMNRDDLPGEAEQYEALRELVEGMAGRPVTVRTLDVGGDKLAYNLAGHIEESVNPALGLRAIRLSLKERALLETQLAAMLRAGAHGPIRILLPMIATAGEVRQVREILKKVATRLRRRRVPIPDPLPPLGVMIEVPGAALSADALARASDFFSIGTNDLTMYTLAIDRSDDQVAHLYNPLHPAVLRLIQFTTEAAFRGRIPVCLCGEMAGDPRYTPLLLGLGIRDLSMAAVSLPRVKQRIRSIDLIAATRRANLIMDQADAGRIAALLDDFNGLA